MRITSRLPPLALLCLAALTLGACGGSGERSSAETQKLLKDTFGTTKPVRSGRLALGIQVRADGITGVPSPLTVKLGGPFQQTSGGGTPKFDFDVDLATRDGRFSIGIISTGKAGWLKLGQRAFTLPSDQLAKLVPQAGGAGSADLGSLGIDPRGWIRNVRDEGVETLEGAKVVHLSADVDTGDLAKDLDSLLSAAGGTGLGAIAGLPGGSTSSAAVAKAVKSAGVDIWTGERDHQLRRIKIKLTVATPSGKPGTVALDLAVNGLGEPQPIGPPANPRPLSELSAALAVLGNLRSGQGASASGTPPATQGYEACLQAAGGDLSKTQDCAALLN